MSQFTVTPLRCPLSGVLLSGVSDGTVPYTGNMLLPPGTTPQAYYPTLNPAEQGYLNSFYSKYGIPQSPPAAISVVPAGTQYSVIMPGFSSCPPSSNNNPYKPLNPPINAISTKSVQRTPASNEIVNIYYDSLSGRYFGTWKPATPNEGTQTTYSNGTTKTVYDGTSSPQTVISLSKNGPWVLDGSQKGMYPVTNISSIVSVGGILLIGADTGVFRSEDNGLTFKYLQNSPTDVGQLVVWNKTVFAVTFTTSPGLVYNNEQNFGQIYSSIDSGNTWALIYEKSGFQFANNPTIPIVVPLPQAPVVLDTFLQPIAGAGTSSPYVQSAQTGIDLKVYSPSTYAPASVQPVYMGQVNGTHYVFYSLQESSPSPDAGVYGVAFYTIDANAGATWVGYALAPEWGLGGVAAYYTWSNKVLLDNNLIGWDTNFDLACNTVVNANGNIFSTPSFMMVGGPMTTVGGKPV